MNPWATIYKVEFVPVKIHSDVKYLNKYKNKSRSNKLLRKLTEINNEEDNEVGRRKYENKNIKFLFRPLGNFERVHPLSASRLRNRKNFSFLNPALQLLISENGLKKQFELKRDCK